MDGWVGGSGWMDGWMDWRGWDGMCEKYFVSLAAVAFDIITSK